VVALSATWLSAWGVHDERRCEELDREIDRVLKGEGGDEQH